LGDVSSTISGVVTRRSPLVDVISYDIQVSVDNGAFTSINSGALPPSGGSYSYLHNDPALKNSTSLAYRVQVVDGFQTTTSGTVTINLVYRNALGFSSSTSVTLSQIESFGNILLTNSKARSFTGVSAGALDFTYYVYAASAGDLTNVILDGTTPIFGAFTKLADVSGVNVNGANVTYRVYKSNDPGAFTNNSLQFI
jgi:hypothetical protein